MQDPNCQFTWRNTFVNLAPKRLRAIVGARDAQEVKKMYCRKVMDSNDERIPTRHESASTPSGSRKTTQTTFMHRVLADRVTTPGMPVMLRRIARSSKNDMLAPSLSNQRIPAPLTLHAAVTYHQFPSPARPGYCHFAGVATPPSHGRSWRNLCLLRGGTVSCKQICH